MFVSFVWTIFFTEKKMDHGDLVCMTTLQKATCTVYNQYICVYVCLCVCVCMCVCVCVHALLM